MGRVLRREAGQIMPHSELEEVMQEIQKVPVPASNRQFFLGDIVKWSYEVEGDPAFGTLYMIVGFNSEKADIVVTRVLGRPYQVREFHVSQLSAV